MERYIAFLRGINVGGNNTVSMSELKKQFERNGFFDVVTYINSIAIRNANTVKKLLLLEERRSSVEHL